jgi:prepilin-type N-terminal cleavage/methylation domain-containing protein
MQKTKGFTLMELLVVIAVIAVLASTVLVGVTGYIGKGKDASAKGNMSTMSVAATEFVDKNGNYTGFETSANWNRVSSALSVAGYSPITYFSNTTHWCASVPMKAITGNYCIDSSGNKKEGSTCATATKACP